MANYSTIARRTAWTQARRGSNLSSELAAAGPDWFQTGVMEQFTEVNSVADESPMDVAIRTPDRRLRVFVSSSLGELADERRAVKRAITTMRLTPVLFELGARPHPPQDLYRAYLAQSDIFIGLYWQSYGQLVGGLHVSGLEEEFDLSAALPRLLYLKAPRLTGTHALTTC